MFSTMYDHWIGVFRLSFVIHDYTLVSGETSRTPVFTAMAPLKFVIKVSGNEIYSADPCSAVNCRILMC